MAYLPDIIGNVGILRFDEVDASDAGAYVCIARNDYGVIQHSIDVSVFCEYRLKFPAIWSNFLNGRWMAPPIPNHRNIVAVFRVRNNRHSRFQVTSVL